MVGNVVYSGGEMQAKQETVERTVTLGDFYTQPITLQDFMGETHNAQAKVRAKGIVGQTKRHMPKTMPGSSKPEGSAHAINCALQELGTSTAEELAELCGCTTSRVSAHLAALKRTGWANALGDGRWVFAQAEGAIAAKEVEIVAQAQS